MEQKRGREREKTIFTRIAAGHTGYVDISPGVRAGINATRANYFVLEIYGEDISHRRAVFFKWLNFREQMRRAWV